MSATVERSAPRTVVVHGGALDDWLAERRRLGQDGRDEVWAGVYHVVPHAHSSHGRLAHRLSIALAGCAAERGLFPMGEFTFGTGDRDYRVPDMGWTSTPLEEATLYVPSVEVVVEFESPGDETWAKVPFYFERGAGEAWVITPQTSSVQVLTGPDSAVERSGLLGVSTDEVAAVLGWR
ncbi:Uma2 family endonuclease [Kineococcus sp. SYSU DK003]|uniref:Uma2 family endonuclease n=1 Tax=Kineococcus sp. SYSU DK003 TaxID=3383124 RepID=UPI003D7CB2E6